MPESMVSLPAEAVLERRRFGDEASEFELVRMIGEGAQGKVYACTHIDAGADLEAQKADATQVRYAAKVLPRVSIEAEERLRHEIAIMERLHHPRVVNMHAHFWEHSRVIIVMDLANGGDLFSKIEEQLKAAVSEGRVFRGVGGAESGPKYITRQFLDAIGYMHHRNITHRDLKAENILICGTHRTASCELYDVKICDFGLSKKHSMSEVQTPGGGGGTPSYAAPERFKHMLEPRRAFNEEVAEFWSFGVLLFLMLCGSFPYDVMKNDSVQKVLQKIRTMVPSGGSWDLISAEGQNFVRGLLRLDPSERFCLESDRSCLVQPWLVGEVGAVEPVAPAGANGVVGYVRAWTGDAVDRIELHMRSGAVLTMGKMGGQRKTDVSLEPDELIVAVMQERRLEGYLGNAVVLYTSSGRVVALRGNHASDSAHFAVPRDSQIAGLQFDGSRLVGVHLMPAEHGGAVEVIEGRSATAVDRVTLKLRSGRIRSYGGDGGRQESCFRLEKDELITAVEQVCRDWFLGCSLVFYTSRGRVFRIKGVASDRSSHFAVDTGRQICDLRFAGNRLSEVETCAADLKDEGPHRHHDQRLSKAGSF